MNNAADANGGTDGQMRRRLKGIEIVFFENLLAQQFFKIHFCCLLR